MKALVFSIRLNSLFSIRVPFTWQSALTYPVLPPSAVIGLCANALQRYKNNRPPVEYLKELEQQILWSGSRLLGPCVIKSYITSAITKWEDSLEGKSTNALGRQFGYTRLMQCVVIFREEVPDELIDALMRVPLTCGDSESALSIEEMPQIKDVTKKILSSDEDVITNFPVPFRTECIIEGTGRVYLMHKRCLKKDRTFPLASYICPVKEEEGILKPSQLKVRCPKGSTVAEIERTGEVILIEN